MQLFFPNHAKTAHIRKKLPLLIPLVMRHGSYFIIVMLIMPALPLEWKQPGQLRSLVHQKRRMDYITLPIMGIMTARHILLSKIYMVQTNLLKSLNVSITIKKVSVRGFVIWKKKQTNKQTNKDKRTGGKEKLTNTKTDVIPNYVGIGLRSNVGNLAAMESVCMALMYHTCGYHDNCPKSADPWC